MSSRRLAQAEATLGVLLVGYGLFGSYTTAPPTPRTPSGDPMNLGILLIGPTAVVGGLLIADAIRRRTLEVPPWNRVVVTYLTGPVIGLVGPVAYLGYSPNYAVGASTLVFFPLGILLGTASALAVLARRTVSSRKGREG